MFDYNNVFDVEKVNLTVMDNVTLIDWELLDLGYDEFNERNYLVIEVWLDEDNTIKILEQSDDDSIEISDKLTKEQKNHIHELVKKELAKFVDI